MSLAKLTAVSTKTLSLILESQRLQALPLHSSDGNFNGNNLHFPQIKRNLSQLREGILALEVKDGFPTEASKLLRSQYERMRGMMLEEQRAEIPRFVHVESPVINLTSLPHSLERHTSQLPSSEEPVQATRQSARDSLLSQPTFAPYTDDPDQSYAEPPEPATVLQVQRLLMDGEGPLSIKLETFCLNIKSRPRSTA